MPSAGAGQRPATAPERDRRTELQDRLAISILVIPGLLFFMEAGGWLYLAGVLLVLGIAAFEFARLFRAGGQRPAMPLVVMGVVWLVAAEYAPAMNPGGGLSAGLLLAALAWHLVDFERGAPAAATDFAVTLAGIGYLGGLGRYFIALRLLPDGLWWLLASLVSVWFADSGAYLIGRAFGRRRLAPRLSPKKTWEGVIGGIVVAGGLGGLLSLGWGLGAGPGSLLTWQAGLALGLLVGVLGPLGDLGISMIKRQAGAKDSGTFAAGHGGALDRIDSWLVAVTVGYYFATWLPHVLGWIS